MKTRALDWKNHRLDRWLLSFSLKTKASVASAALKEEVLV